MTGTRRQTISVSIQRSRVLNQHHAYVRVDCVEAGYRDLRTGIVHCTEPGFRAVVAESTAPLLAAATNGSSTAQLYRTVLEDATALSA